MFFIGSFKKKKFNKLGTTPLTLNSDFCTIGDEFSGSIETKRENFNKIKMLSITSLK